MVAGGLSACASAAQGESGRQVSAQSVPGRPPAGLQEVANQMVAAGAPGVIIMSRNGRHVSHVVAGLADNAARQPMQPQDKVYIDSITKTSVATVVLQLAAEGRLSLDDSAQQLLPGVITGLGYDPDADADRRCWDPGPG